MGHEGQVLVRHGCGAAMLLAAALGAQQAELPSTEPVVHADRTVTFHYSGAGAEAAGAKVSVALEGVREPIAMSLGADGVWTYTSPVLAPEIYYYHFKVGDKRVLDPRNFEVVHSLTAKGSWFLVPGETGAPWEDAAIPHGVVARHTYTTKAAVGLPNNQSEFYVYTPPGYDARGSVRYPVLYLLHGWSQTASEWSGFGRANEILDAEIAAGKAKPMIVVMPTGYGDMSFARHGMTVWNDQAQVSDNVRLFSKALLTEVVPQVEGMYRVSARREDRAIVGLSMGGLESLMIGLSSPQTFAYVGGMSAALDAAHLPAMDAKKADLKLVWIACGTADELADGNRQFAEALRQKGFNVTSQETRGGMHTWIVWRQNLVDFTGLLFR